MGEAARGISRSHIGNTSAGPHYINFLTSAPVFVVGARPVLGAPFQHVARKNSQQSLFRVLRIVNAIIATINVLQGKFIDIVAFYVI